METSKTERLMNALINKMETMDNSLGELKVENQQLRKMLLNPSQLLKRAGFVSTSTPFSEDIDSDPFRADMGLGDAALLKTDNNAVIGDMTSEEIHGMTWDEIHEMAEQSRDVDVVN